MRKYKFYLLLILSSFLMITCGDKKSNESISAPEGMHALDLSKYGKPFYIFVPDTTKNVMEINENSSGTLEVSVGKNFGISIEEQEADLNIKKQDLKDDEVNRFKQYLNEEPNAIAWESEIVKPEYHFIVNAKSGSAVYSFQDLKDSEKGSYSKDAVIRMYESSKNIKEKAKS